MKQFFALILASVFLYSCGSSSKKEEVKALDSTALETKVESSMSFDDQSFKTLQFPLVLDTVFVEKVDTNDRITYQQFRAQGLNILKHDISERINYTIDDFIKIDSLKQIGKYKNYIDSLDIGMTKQAIAYKIGVLNFKNATKLFIWGFQLKSFEACPFFTYNKIVGTYVDENKKSTHILLAEVSGGGDPPLIGDEKAWSVVKEDGTIEMNYFSVTDDLDIPGQNTFMQSFKMELLKDKIVVSNDKKKEEKGEKETPNE